MYSPCIAVPSVSGARVTPSLPRSSATSSPRSRLWPCARGCFDSCQLSAISFQLRLAALSSAQFQVPVPSSQFPGSRSRPRPLTPRRLRQVLGDEKPRLAAADDVEVAIAVHVLDVGLHPATHA